jgi:hypothetical protein
MAPDASVRFLLSTALRFSSPLLWEWQDTLDQHQTNAAASPDSLIPHYSCFQSLQAACCLHPQNAQHFVFTTYIWVAIHPSEVETWSSSGSKVAIHRTNQTETHDQISN